MSRATEIWSLKERHQDTAHKYLIVSFISNTRLMHMNDEGLEDVSDNCGLDLNSQTLFVTNSIGESSDIVAQITETSVIISNIGYPKKLCQWDVLNGPIICGYAVDEQVIVATKGGVLILLKILLLGNAYAFKR